MRRMTIMLIIIGLGGTALLQGQTRRDAAEQRGDRRQMATDGVQALADMADVRRLERLAAELDAARAAGDHNREQAVQVRIAAELRRESAEGRRDLAQDRLEAAGARAEVRGDRRDIRRDRAAGAPTGGDRRALRDDRRDARDDARDAAASADRARRQQDLLAELRRIQPDVQAGNDDASRRQRGLLEEFLKVAREDARATGRELGEDRRELREDRRRP